MQRLLLAGVVILLLGFGLIIVGSATQTGVSTGGVVFIGPFPIVFGSGPSGSSLALVSVVIGGVMVALVMLFGWRMLGRGGRETG
ncbi:MAG TPA: DUF131 domain-containing protein [Nitrososphaerales archaeon]|nr:DUF131 domain-containing protein [Nitrososphaerales archaeon]